MRQAYGGTWLIQFVLVFIILFAVYIVLTLDYSKTIKVKNEAISIIEKYDGLNEKSISTLNNYLASSGYRTMGGCGERDDFYGATDLNASELEIAENGKKYYYCIKKYKANKNNYYYQISLFYNFNINFLGVSTYYTVKGTTSSFEPHDDAAYGGSPNYEHMNPSEPNNSNNSGNSSNNPEPSKEKYTIVFDFNGGKYGADQLFAGYSSLTDYQPKGYNKRFDGMWESTTKTGYTLDYFIDQDGNKYYKSNASFTVNKDMKLTAVWKTGNSGSNNGEFKVPEGYTLAGVCEKNSIHSLEDFIINCGKRFGYYTSRKLVISGFPVTDGEKTTFANINAFACDDYISFMFHRYNQAEINACKSELESLYDYLPNRVIYK